jgi:hypothetical protein
LRFFETWCKRRIFHTYLWFIWNLMQMTCFPNLASQF